MLHIPIKYADDVNKLIVIPHVVVNLAILSLLSASITQLYTMKHFNTMCFIRKLKRKRLNLLTDSKEKR